MKHMIELEGFRWGERGIRSISNPERLDERHDGSPDGQGGLLQFSVFCTRQIFVSKYPVQHSKTQGRHAKTSATTNVRHSYYWHMAA